MQFRLCWGNLGNLNITTSTPLHFVLTLNETITTSDTPIANDTWSLPSINAHSAACTTLGLVMPNVNAGDYLIGYFLGTTASSDTNAQAVGNLRVTIN